MNHVTVINTAPQAMEPKECCFVLKDAKHCLIQNVDMIAFLTNKISFGPQ
jgi:hypothetical protein